MDCSPPGSSVHGIFQARILEWVAIYFSRGSSQPRDWTWVSCIGRRIHYSWAIREVPAFTSKGQMHCQLYTEIRGLWQCLVEAGTENPPLGQFSLRTSLKSGPPPLGGWGALFGPAGAGVCLRCLRASPSPLITHGSFDPVTLSFSIRIQKAIMVTVCL